MKVLHINFSKSGGAGGFARDLAAAQIAKGIDARIFNLRDSDLRSEPLRDPLLTLQAFLDEFLLKSIQFDSPISLLRRGTRLTRDDSSFVPDLIHLHWIEGVVSDAWLKKVSVPIVWTLHDFRPITGACHHPLGCEQLSTGCHSCPAVKPIFRNLVARSMASRTQLGTSNNVHYVAPSKWVAEIAMRSGALSTNQVPVIYNASPEIHASSKDMHWFQDELGDSNKPIIAIAFGSSVSKLKGQSVLDSINPGVFDGYRVVTFGAGALTWAHNNLGVISREKVSVIFADAKLAIIPSQAETFSLAAFEATRVGTTVCGLPGGAVQEIAETFGEFLVLDTTSIQSFLQEPNPITYRKVSREMSDVVGEYQVIYQKALSASELD